MAPLLHVCDKDGYSKGMIEARVGLSMGPGRKIVKVTPTTITVENSKSGSVLTHRRQDAALPSVPLYLCPAEDRAKLATARISSNLRVTECGHPFIVESGRT